MRAVQFSSFGGPEVLEFVKLDEPHPGPGQVRIAVRAVGVNPIDWKVRSGAMGGDLPRRTGIEASGVVDELGEGVEGVKLGDAVFGPTAGGAAEFAVLGNWARMPQSLDFTGAAALPVATETAARMLDLVGVQDGQTIVVNGASGSVGLAAVQLGQERGARVIGTASTRNHDLLRSFGAEPTTYGEGLQQRVRELAPGGVDRALDAAGGGALPALVALTGSADRVVTIVDFQGAQETGARASGGPGEPRAWYILSEVAKLIDQGRFTLPVARTFAIEQIADAHRLSQSGHPGGKVVVTVG